MDKSERARLKQLAIDTIIANPVYSAEAKLAEALEQCVDELSEHSKCPVCGEDEDEPDWVSLATSLEGLGFRLEPL